MKRKKSKTHPYSFHIVMFLLCVVLFGSIGFLVKRIHTKPSPILHSTLSQTAASPTAEPIPTGYIYNYPGMLDPVIAIGPGSETCSPEYAKNPDIHSYYDALNATTFLYYQGSNVANQVWEKNSYVIASSIGFSLLTGRVLGDNTVYASPCTSHYLIRTTNFVTQDQGNERIFLHPAPIMSFAPGILINIAQFPFNDPLFRSDTTYLNDQPDFAMAHCHCQFNGNPQAIQINGETMLVDNYTVQTNRSKKYGLLYQTMYELNNNLVAQISYDSTGKVISFTK